MRQKAQFLLDEAATWSLLWYLYGKGNQPLSSNTSLLEIDACDDQVFHNFYGLSSLLKFFGLNLEVAYCSCMLHCVLVGGFWVGASDLFGGGGGGEKFLCMFA
jgi:hypothetical protein